MGADMRCTDCGKEARALHTRSWSAERGDIVRNGERICRECYRKRGGRSLREIEREMREKGEI